MDPEIESVLNNFIDWRDFEKFVAELYKDSAEVKVEHNVELIGKYQEKRQVDVLVTQTTKLHTIKTIVECKFWKDKVDRSRVDIVVAALESLDANKGVIITTVGYEEGAINYAKGKNIDIFIVRSVLDEEWGNTGRVVKLWIQMFSSKLEGLTFGNTRFYSSNGLPPANSRVNLVIKADKDQVYLPEHDLHSLKFERGPNFVKILFDVQLKIAQDLNNKTNGLIETNEQQDKWFVRTIAKLDFSKYNFPLLPHEHGFIVLDKVNVSYLLSVSQTKIEIDRGRDFNYVLMIENYITKQKNFVAKNKDTESIVLSEPIQKNEIEPENDLRKGGIIKITTDHYVGFEVPESAVIQKANDVDVILGNK